MINRNFVSIVGGAGHVGAPLGLVLSSKGYNVILVDKNKENIKKINHGKMPFIEEGCEKLLKKMIIKKKIYATTELSEVKKCKYIIICLGTPINNKFEPNLKNFINFFYELKKYLNKNHIIIIRSSIYPGICNKVFNIIKKHCKNLSYCPERIAQGQSLKELPKISQIISGKNTKSKKESGKIFKKVCKKVIYLKYHKGFKLGCFTAPSKGNTLLNCLNLKKKVIEFASENNKKKIGKYTPGTHIKIISDNAFIKKKIDYAILLSWNYKKFFLSKSLFAKKGKKFIIPLPTPYIK